MKRTVSLLFGLALLISPTMSQSGGTFVIQKSVIAGGGDHSTGGTFILDGTIGQAVAGTQSSGGSFNVVGGFWTAAGTVVALSLRGDVAPRPNGDGTVQSNDVVQVQRFQIGLDSIVPG